MKMLILFGLLALAAVGSSLPNPSPNQRIMVGQNTTITDIPFQVSIQYLGHACSGSIIAPQWVLTAASCVSGLAEQATLIRWGSSYHNQGGTFAKIEKIIINPSYDRPTFFADIALIKTIDVMNTLPAVVATSSDPLMPSVTVTISGWGITSLDHGQFSPIIQKATIPYITLAHCRPFYESLAINLPADVICGGDVSNGGASICRGDIGGPVTYKWDVDAGGDGIRKVYGVSSFTLTCGGVGQPSVFTDVKPYRAWIKEVSGA